MQQEKKYKKNNFCKPVNKKWTQKKRLSNSTNNKRLDDADKVLASSLVVKSAVLSIDFWYCNKDDVLNYDYKLYYIIQTLKKIKKNRHPIHSWDIKIDLENS